MQKSRVSVAYENHKKGYNCAQAVACAYSELLGMDEKTAFRAAEGFGLGIVGTNQTCGAVCGMIMLAGLKNSDGNLSKPQTKLDTFALGRSMEEKFTEKNTTVMCNKLRGTDGITDRIRSCRGCIIDCAQITEDILFPSEFEPYSGPMD
ncbi:MAG: C-GCAxxG-C-C family protein [Clostridiales bacterium]|nr:C-GCAxxG-C-C family protein [Clostridiales bacterium]